MKLPFSLETCNKTYSWVFGGEKKRYVLPGSDDDLPSTALGRYLFGNREMNRCYISSLKLQHLTHWSRASENVTFCDAQGCLSNCWYTSLLEWSLSQRSSQVLNKNVTAWDTKGYLSNVCATFLLIWSRSQRRSRKPYFLKLFGI